MLVKQKKNTSRTEEVSYSTSMLGVKYRTDKIFPGKQIQVTVLNVSVNIRAKLFKSLFTHWGDHFVSNITVQSCCTPETYTGWEKVGLQLCVRETQSLFCIISYFLIIALFSISNCKLMFANHSIILCQLK